MEIVYRDLDLLKPNPKNPRKATETSITQLAESITKNPAFFEARPILLSNRTGELVIIGGERRSEAARYLGMEKAPTILLEGLTEAEEDEIMIRDNTHNGKWDTDMLRAWSNEDLKKWAAPEWEESKRGENWGSGEGEHALTKGNDVLYDSHSQVIGKVVYEPKQTNHEIRDLYEMPEDLDAVIATIKNKELRKMLEIRKDWFCKFNFSKIADYYAYQATPEEQRAFEKLGLVLLDLNQLIENGFANILKDFDNEENHE